MNDEQYQEHVNAVKQCIKAFRKDDVDDAEELRKTAEHHLEQAKKLVDAAEGTVTTVTEENDGIQQ